MPRQNHHPRHERFEPTIPCSRKRRFRSEDEALKMVKVAELNLTAPALHVYLCPYCGGWHLSSSETSSKSAA